jgi:hypothetical protein
MSVKQVIPDALEQVHIVRKEIELVLITLTASNINQWVLYTIGTTMLQTTNTKLLPHATICSTAVANDAIDLSPK